MYVGLREMDVRSSLLTETLSDAHYAKATWVAKQPNESEIPIDTAQYIGQDIFVLGGRNASNHLPLQYRLSIIPFVINAFRKFA